MARWNWGGVSAFPFTILVHLVGILCVTLVLVWMIHFRGGLAWSTSKKSLLFNIHPVLVTVCFIFISSEAIVHFKSSAGSKLYKKTIHSVLNAIALTGAIVGVAAVFKFHNEIGSPHLFSLHAWLGLVTIILFGLQWISGFLVFLFPRFAKKTRGRVLPWHVFVGLVAYVAALASAESGIMELMVLLEGRNAMGRFSPEARLANGLGLSLLLLGALVVLSSVLPSPSPSPATKPNDAITSP